MSERLKLRLERTTKIVLKFYTGRARCIPEAIRLAKDMPVYLQGEDEAGVFHQTICPRDRVEDFLRIAGAVCKLAGTTFNYNGKSISYKELMDKLFPSCHLEKFCCPKCHKAFTPIPSNKFYVDFAGDKGIYSADEEMSMNCPVCSTSAINYCLVANALQFVQGPYELLARMNRGSTK